MTSTPYISVIIPVYNGRTYLEACVNSIITQDFKSIELILVDDGSTDGSSDLCDKLSATDPRIRIIHKKNGGTSDSRNCGITASQGKWLTFVDQDDIIPQNAFSAYEPYLDMVDIDLIQGQIFQGSPSDFVASSQSDFKEDRILSICEFAELSGTYRMNVWAKLYKTAIAKQISFPTGFFGEDTYYNGLYLANPRVKNAVIVSRIVYLYFLHNQSSQSSAFTTRDYYGICQVSAKLYNKVSRNSVDPRIRSVFLRVFFSQYCACKYALIQKKQFKGLLKRKMYSLRRRHIQYLLTDKNISFVKRFAILLTSQYNFIYHIWVLINSR